MSVLTAEVLELLAHMEESTLDIPDARTLPSACYTSEEFFAFEMESVFAREWLCLGHIRQLPENGTYFTAKIGDEPLVVTRDDDGQVHVMSAICQHRGYPIVEGSSGKIVSLRCPYHSWAYGLDGSLVAAPEMQRTCDLSALKRSTRLPPLSVEVWNGLIFATMRPDPEPLAPTLAKLDEEIAEFDMASLVPMPDLEYPHQPWNWKGMHENALEPYHTSYVHKGYHEVAPASQASFYSWDAGDGQIMHPTGFRVLDGGFNPTGRALFPVIAGLSEKARGRVLFASIPPTVFLAFMPDQVFLFHIFPERAEEITLRITWLFPESTLADPFFEWKYQSQTGANDILNQQDMVTNAAMQRGQRSRFAPRGPYSYQEATLPQFNRWLIRRYREFAGLAGESIVPEGLTT
jgi:phenylpropionate dioxygenase-like ring-hydroxylating dioxygenase large terminal subunit